VFALPLHQIKAILIMSFRRAGYSLFRGEEWTHSIAPLHKEHLPMCNILLQGQGCRQTQWVDNEPLRWVCSHPSGLIIHGEASLDVTKLLGEVDSLAPAPAEPPALMIGLYALYA
jgi:hypothetical protein